MPGSSGGEQGGDGSTFDPSALVVSESPSPAIHPGAPAGPTGAWWGQVFEQVAPRAGERLIILTSN